jgi:catechol 2,3-dioxygenase-like lactoylglutathione lyase family enzyme
MARRLSRIELICRDPDRLAAFYEAALGFIKLIGPEDIRKTASASITLRLGQQEITLIGACPMGQPYPAHVAGWSLLFQHIAIVVSDMTGAYARLSTIHGWTPISTAGPQLLPIASGGVEAYKFRDPEGHPLELIAFAPDATPIQWQRTSGNYCVGIDHSAVSVSNTLRSIAFYESLGLRRAASSLNVGQEQAKLDDVPSAVVEVTALAPERATPHVELLCYRGDFDRHFRPQAANDATATRLVFTVKSQAMIERICARHPNSVLSGPIPINNNIHGALLCDPDGHLISLEAEI